MQRRSNWRWLLGVGLAVGAAACGGDAPTALDVVEPQFQHNPQVPRHSVQVCKTGPEGTGGSFAVTMSGTGRFEPGPFTLASGQTLPGNCRLIWVSDTGTDAATLTITETPSAGSVLDVVTITGETTPAGQPISWSRDGNTVTVSVTPVVDGITVYFKNVAVPVVQPASLGDRVWLDTNANGIQDPGEPGTPGVTVNLFSTCPAGATPVATMQTDASGLYLFTGLTPGSYMVQFVRPAGYSSSPANQGADDAADSDADPETGMTGCYTLAAGETNLTLDAGLYQLAAVTGGIVGCVYVDGFGTGGAGLGLRQAGQFGAFAINGGQLLLNSATVAGDVALGPGATTSGLLKTSITGTFYHHQAEPPSFSAKDFLVSGGFQRMDLTAAEADANARSAELAASTVPAGNALGNVTSSLALTRGAGIHVFSVSSIDYKSSVLTLSGPADAVFVFNVAGTFKFAQSQVALAGGVSAANVIFNVPTIGDIIEVHKAESVFNGTILAPHREVRYSDPGVFNGAIIARIVKIYSGARLFHTPHCLAGVVLSLTDTSTGLSRTVTTTTDGFGFTDMVAGRAYTLRLSSLPAGFAPHGAFAGSFGGSVASATTVSGITVPAAGGTGTGYDFAVRRN
jgi:hypothetical protein